MATSTQNQASEDLFRQAIRAWESAAETGVKMQEESAKWLRQTFSSETGSMTDWYNKSQSILSETIVKSQENIDETVRLMNQQAESSIRLIQKALEAKGGESEADAREKFTQWWETAVETMRANSEAVLNSNRKVLATWTEMAKKIQDQATGVMSDLSKKSVEQAAEMTRATTDRAKEMVGQMSGNGAS